MKTSPVTGDPLRRLMYVERKGGDLDGAGARIGWVEFSSTGRTLYYRGRSLQRARGGGINGNYFELKSGAEYWVTAVRKRGGNSRWAEEVQVEIDPDARDEYRRIVGE